MTSRGWGRGLATTAPNRASQLCLEVAGDVAAAAGEAMERAVSGDLDAVRDYVTAYRSLVRAFCSNIGEWQPGLIASTGDSLLIVDMHGHKSAEPWEVIELTAAEAPFSRWVAKLGPAEGTAVCALASIRETIPSLKPLSLPDDGAAKVYHRGSPTRFAQLVVAELRGEKHPVERVREIFGLSKSGMGELFGVSAEAIRGWVPHVPELRQAKLATVLAIGNLLERKLQAGIVPAIARTPADAYGGRNMLEMIRDNRQDELLKLTRESFDWAATA